MKYPLALFDSGVGGFSVLRNVLSRHGDVPCLYLADTARVPYGNRSQGEIRGIALEVVSWLENQKVSAVLMACNTTNSLAFDVVQNSSRFPVFGLIQAVTEMIIEDRIGVLATPATVSSGAYRSAIQSSKPGVKVFEQGCPELVPLIEAGHIDSHELVFILKKYLKPLLDARVQAIVLGCTHYPLIEEALRRLLPNEVRLIDPSIGLARNLDSLLGAPVTLPVQKTCSYANTRFCVTADPESFASKSSNLLGCFPIIELVSLIPKPCFS